MENFVRPRGEKCGEGDVVIDPEKFLKILEAAMGEAEDGGKRDGGGDLEGYFSEEEEEYDDVDGDEESTGSDKEVLVEEELRAHKVFGVDGEGGNVGEGMEEDDVVSDGEDDEDGRKKENEHESGKVWLGPLQMDSELGTKRPPLSSAKGDDDMIEVDTDVVTGLIEDILEEEGGLELASHLLEEMGLKDSIPPPPTKR